MKHVPNITRLNDGEQMVLIEKRMVDRMHEALMEIGAGYLDGETLEKFTARCMQVAKEAIK